VVDVSQTASVACIVPINHETQGVIGRRDGGDLITPNAGGPESENAASWNGATQALQWFTTREAEEYAKSKTRGVVTQLNQKPMLLQAVFNFAYSVVAGRAFVAKSPAPRFIGYRSAMPFPPGCVLLDATSEVDGLQQICPWRRYPEAPKARYDNLTIISIPPHTTQQLTKYLSLRKNRDAYVAWAQEKEHVRPGELAVVVVKKTLIDLGDIPTTEVPDNLDELTRDQRIAKIYSWDVEGRRIATTYWGTGIGSNVWKDAQVIVLLDDFILPKRVAIANAQGLWNLKSIEGALGRMKSQRSKDKHVTPLWEGHILRWMKQLALRGTARNYDEHGVCGEQRLVCAVDRKRLLANADRLFPGAKIVAVGHAAKAATKDTGKKPYADQLLETLSSPGLPDKLTAKELGKLMGVPWRRFSKDVMQRPEVKAAIENLGWRYVSGRGRNGSWFERVVTEPIALRQVPKPRKGLAARLLDALAQANIQPSRAA
jgi:hypothetical protein